MHPSPHPSKAPIAFAGSELRSAGHICGFFRNAEEEYQLLLPFIKEGIERGEKVFHVVDPKLRKDCVRRLESVGIDVEAAEQSGQFELRDWNQTYFHDGRFDQERMLATWQELLGAAGQKFTRTRLVAHMEWSLHERDGVSDLIEYEARYNLIHHAGNAVVCAYDLRRFRADVIMDVLRAHPMIIVGGILQENPLFVPPQEFLREFRARRTHPAKRPAAN
jgi:MEDS: MEthanogen/methylotroph, DcmR Sensory domain